MGRHNGHGSLRNSINKKEEFPQVYFDKHLDFTSIKLAPGIEERSYLKGGLIFCENKKGQVIEIQMLNSDRKKRTKKKRI